ncbi:MAG: histidine phosphatase family protein [Proteobacteria bacterium]|nr:histidine phosphatase family protein [Pseudomonadota bacterium]
MSELYFVRHGQASFGDKDYDRLSPTGIKQAQILARHMLCTGQSFDAVYSGTLFRQKNTAKELIGSFKASGRSIPEPVESGDFDEYDSLMVWKTQIPLLLKDEPSVSDDLSKIRSDKRIFQMIFEKVMRRWVSGDFDQPGSPSWSDFKNRVEKGITGIMERHGAGRKIIIFTSGGPISAAVQQALGLSDNKTIEISWQIMNASVTRFKYNSSGMALSVFNDITHIEIENDKNLITYR